MGSERFEVRPGDLLAHRTHVDAIAQQVEQARSAGGIIRADIGAYGKLCTIVPAMLNTLQRVLIDGVAGAAEDLRVTGDKLQATADDYNGMDRTRAAAVRAAGNSL
ncbi:ESX-1 secretion-associated protein [Couchioplanes caeruleus]|uniref:type VII secretion target n=1 Tax=Couchioplanes caeruleus TaxID=56438 RepID=UPI00201BEE07|nr:type VII secretion target [Couchioplanes caeruleus]UQU67839.1 ESX-1 secretion-associated protein [Couchioplanes caeruleus]